MKNNLEHLIEDQIKIEFTGRIQLLDKQSYQNLGQITLASGRIINAKFKNTLGERGFISALLNQKLCKFILETEIINEKRVIEKPYRDLIEAFEEAIIQQEYYNYFKVPEDIALHVNPIFLERGASLTHTEYSILLGLASQGYEEFKDHLNLLDYEITKGLISLRKKGALKTIKKRRELRV